MISVDCCRRDFSDGFSCSILLLESVIIWRFEGLGLGMDCVLEIDSDIGFIVIWILFGILGVVFVFLCLVIMGLWIDFVVVFFFFFRDLDIFGIFRLFWLFGLLVFLYLEALWLISILVSMLFLFGEEIFCLVIVVIVV